MPQFPTQTASAFAAMCLTVIAINATTFVPAAEPVAVITPAIA